MALRLWLPLNGDLHNQGLDGEATAVTATNGSFVTNGKIGKCLKLGYTNNIIIPSLIGSKKMSWAYWCRIDEATATNWLDPIHWTSTKADGSDGFTSRQEFYTNCTNTCVWYKGGSLGRGSFGNIVIGEWNHFAFTIDYEAGEAIFYINGNQVSKGTTVDTTHQIAAIHNIRLGENGLSVSENDVRIYDNILSVKEVKELSKGLVLHYPLSDPYVEGTTNLITSEDCLSSICYNGATSKYNYGSYSDIYKIVTTFEGQKGTKVYMGTDGNAAYPYVYINNMYTSNGTNSPEYKTLSFDYYTTISTSISPYKLGNGTGTATYKVTNTTTKTGTGTNSVVIPVKPNMWNHIEITFHGTTDADAQWGYIKNQPSHTSDTSNFWFFANMQLEAKDHATGYTKYNTSRNENVVYDVSGYQNNGTVVGVLNCSSDTPRYLLSTYIANGTVGHIEGIPLPVSSQTLSMWVKCDKARNQCIFCDKDTQFEFGFLNNFAYIKTVNQPGYSTTHWNNNEWNHIAVIKENNGVWNLYINGQLETNNASNNYYIHNADNFWIGNRRYNNSYPSLNCFISDFRIYATALSADDILELYYTPASITNFGMLMTQGELSEV